MTVKTIFIFCAQALLIQGIYGQCAGFAANTALAAEDYALAGNALAGNALAYGTGYGAVGAAPLAYGAGCGQATYGLNVAPTSGGGFAVISSSPFAPTGISVVSENAIEGAVSVTGELPFLGAVVLEGALPTAGAGGINYGCGSGNVGIVSEGLAPAAAGYPAGLGYGAAGLGASLPYGASGLAGLGYGGRAFGLGGCGGVY